jgi:hypothetical protein
MISIAKSLVVAPFLIVSVAHAIDPVQYPPSWVRPEVLYYIGAESGPLSGDLGSSYPFNTNEFGHSYWPNTGTNPQSYWQGITTDHSRWGDSISSFNAASHRSYYFRTDHGMNTEGSLEKSEVALPFSAGPGQEFYFGISILLPLGYVSQSQWNVFFQMHSSMVLGSMIGLDTAPGEWPDGQANPLVSALGVHYQSGDATTGLGCAMNTCPPVHTPGGEPNYYRKKFADNSPGTWNDIILHVKFSSYKTKTTLNSDGTLEVWHRKAGGLWTNPISQTKIFLGVTYSPKGMVADAYPRAGLYRESWCKTVAVAGSCTLNPPHVTTQPSEMIYLDNIVFATTLGGAQSVFPNADPGF